MSTSTYISFYLRANKVHIFCQALRELGHPHYVRFLVHTDEFQMILQSYHKKDFISFRVPEEIFSGRKAMEVNSKAFCQLMARQLGWDISKSYRIPGNVYPYQKIICFDLRKAVEIKRDVEPF